MPAYDALHFDPPAPVATVTLRSPDSEAMVSDVVMLLDTGADVTLLPRAATERLGVAVLAGQHYELTGFDGGKTSLPVAMLDMVFMGRAFRGLYILTEDDRGIMGRDVLNHLSLLLDGPRQQWSEHGL